MVSYLWRLPVKKRYFALLVVAVLLVFFPSCRKNEDPALSSPVVKVAVEKEEAELPVVAGNAGKETEGEGVSQKEKKESNEAHESAKERKLSMVYRGGSVLLRATFSSDSAVVVTNMDEAFISIVATRFASEYPSHLSNIGAAIDGKNVILSYPSSLSDDYLHAFWNDLRNLLDTMNGENEENENEGEKEYVVSGIPLTLTIGRDKADVKVPDYVSGSDVDAFFGSLLTKNPTLSSKAEYRTEGNTVSLIFSKDVEEDQIPALWEELLKEIEEYAASLSALDAVKEEESEVKEEKKVFSSPLSAAGKTIDRMTVSLSVSGKYDPSVDFASVIKAHFGYALTEDITIGGGFGFDTASFIPLFVTVRHDIPLLEGLYAFGDAGWRFGLSGKTGSLFLDLGLGYEKKISEDFILFGEVEAQMVFAPEVRVMPSVAIGGRYSF